MRKFLQGFLAILLTLSLLLSSSIALVVSPTNGAVELEKTDKPPTDTALRLSAQKQYLTHPGMPILLNSKGRPVLYDINDP